jgi:tRNA1(Val) A37 N6-methylase TrmN6
MARSARFPFGEDALLLADFARPANGEKACDLCSGSGIVPLLWCRKGASRPAQIHALDFQPEAVALMRLSIRENRLEDVIVPLCADIRELRSLPDAGAFDLVSCNPPYFARGSGAVSPRAEKAAARHELFCTLSQAAAAARRLLRFGGRFALCHRPERLPDVLEALRAADLEPKRLCLAYHRLESAPWLILAEGRRGGRPGLRIEPPIYMRDVGGRPLEAGQTLCGEEWR